MKCSICLALVAGVFAGGCAAPATRSAVKCAGCQTVGSALPHATGSIYDLTTRWQTDDGRVLQLSALRGKPVVIAMFYATCDGICVITKDDLKDLEASLPADKRGRVRFVLVTLDPRLDNLDALQAYRSKEELAEGRWMLLRGTPGATAQLAARLGIQYGRDASGRFVHSSLLTVLDDTGKIVQQQDGVHADLASTVKILSAGL